MFVSILRKKAKRADVAVQNWLSGQDDRPEVVRERLTVYHTETEPLEAYYAKKGILKNVAGQERLEDTTALTLKAIGV